MSAQFAVGDRVLVSWMDETVEADVFEADISYRRRRSQPPMYRLVIEGVVGHPMYSEDEMHSAPKREATPPGDAT